LTQTSFSPVDSNFTITSPAMFTDSVYMSKRLEKEARSQIHMEDLREKVLAELKAKQNK